MMKSYNEELSDVSRYIENQKDFAIADKQESFDKILRWIRSYRPLDSSSRVLEIGTGTGWLQILFRKDGINCCGLEISPQLIEYAKTFAAQNGVDVDIRLGNVEETDLGRGEYDVIIACSVFEHVEDWRAGLKKVYDALKPGGLFYFVSTNKFSFVSGEYKGVPLYGWLPDRVRYALRRWKQGSDIMKLGIDFNQFTYPQLRLTFRNLGFLEVHDYLDRKYRTEPGLGLTRNPVKRLVLKAARKSRLVKGLMLWFAPNTVFWCIK